MNPLFFSSGSVAAGGGGASVPNPLTLSPTVYFRENGITGASGDVASWDDEGSAGLRMEAATVGERPTIVTVGSVQGAQFTGTDWLRSTGAIDLSLGGPDSAVNALIHWVCLRVDSLTANDRIIDMDGSFLVTLAGGLIRGETGTTDVITSTPVLVNDVIQLTYVMAPTLGTSKLYLNKVLESSTAGTNSLEPASRIIAMAARGTDGAVPWAGTILEWGIWSAEDETAFDLAALHAYGDDLIARASS